jgi:serine/threonine protein kinase/uncharacterized protein YecT (DUF1311 family)
VGTSADSAERPPDLGSLEADYEILRALGRGGMAVVYLARHRESSRLVAIKTIRRQYVEDREAIIRFAREARTVARLDHPNIVRTHAVELLGERALAIVMEYVPGGTLRDEMRRGAPFSYERAAQVLRDVAAALGYAHSQGVVHRDVKPENIFLDDLAGRALLSDFGIARSIGSETLLTMAGVTLGTPSYMSPEQIEAIPVDGRSDIYSLGLVGWEMLAGKRPWEGDSLYSVIYKQKHEELPRLIELRPDIPAPLLFAIEGAMHKHRDERWANANEFLAQLSAEAQVTPGVGPVAVIRDEGGTRDLDSHVGERDRAVERRARDTLPSRPAAIPPGDVREILPEPAVDTPTIRLSRASGAAEAQDVADARARPAAAAQPEAAEPLIRVAARDAAAESPAERETALDEPDLDAAAARGGRVGASAPLWPGPPSPTAEPPTRAPAATLPIVVRKPWRIRPLGLLIPLALVAVLALVFAQRERSAQRREDAVAALDTLSTTTSAGAVTPRDSARARPGSPPAGAAASARNQSTPARESEPAAAAAVAVAPRGAITDSAGSRQPAAAARSDTAVSAVRGRAAAGTATAGTTAERRIPRSRADSVAACESPALADQRACLYVHIAANDGELNRVYGELIAALRARARSGSRDGDPPAVRQVRAEQRAWLVERDAECRRRTRAEEGALWARVRARCLGEMSDQRAQELAAALDRVRG